MTDRVIRLETMTVPPPKVDDEVVQLLQRMLRRARRGEINGVAIVTLTSPALGAYTGCGTAWAGESVRGAVHTMLGGVDVLHERLKREMIEWGD